MTMTARGRSRPTPPRLARGARQVRAALVPFALAVTLAATIAACGSDSGTDPLSGDPARFTWSLPANWAPPPVPPDNPMSAAKVELGRRLFYDPRLSGNGSQSCASCHRQEFAFADAKNIPLGSTGEPHPRNSMGLANASYLPFLTWADAGTQTLEAQALVPMFGERPVELGLAGRETELLARLRTEPLYQQLFPRSFPADADPFTVRNVTRALAAFQRTLVSATSPFDRATRGEPGAMSEAARRGEQLFRSQRLHCAECHGGPLFTNAAAPGGSPFSALPFFNTGLYNIDGAGGYPARNAGLFERTGDPRDMGRFRTPSLRNLAFTFPYMHDGSASTLGDVIDHYARGGRLIPIGPLAGDGRTSPLKDPRITGFALSPGDRADLVAFLQALSDSAFVRDRRFANPWNP
jgi:cytochrome c peroxidase